MEESSVEMKNAKPQTSMYLPTELMEMIFSKLPTNILMRCKTVCKEWYNLITQFVSAFLKDQTLFLVNSECYTGIIQREMSYVLYSDDNKAFNEYAKLEAPLELWGKCLCVYGFCNGLICLSDCNQLVMLWNPKIQRVVRLPVSDKDLKIKNRFAFGCVFDHINNDFKVIRTTHPRDGSIDVEIFRLSTNLWECWTKGIPFKDIYGNQVVLKGFAHWIGLNSEGKLMIVSFDVHEEVFGSVEIPPALAEDNMTFWGGYPVYLFLFEESLVLIHYAEEHDVNITKSRTRYDFWRMEEYGKGGSWNLWYSIYCYVIRTPLGFRINGQFLWV